jgi:hypothetical protein
VRNLQKERIYMENLTKYSPAILNNNGVAEASMVPTNVGEFVKFSDIKELLQTAHNKQMVGAEPPQISPCVNCAESCKGSPACKLGGGRYA